MLGESDPDPDWEHDEPLYFEPPYPPEIEPCDCETEKGEYCKQCKPTAFLPPPVPNPLREPLNFGKYEGLSVYQIAASKGAEGIEYLRWLSLQKFPSVNKGIPFDPTKGMGWPSDKWYTKNGSVKITPDEVESEMRKINMERRQDIRRLVRAVRRIDAKELRFPDNHRHQRHVKQAGSDPRIPATYVGSPKSFFLNSIRLLWPHRFCDHMTAYESIVDPPF